METPIHMDPLTDVELQDRFDHPIPGIQFPSRDPTFDGCLFRRDYSDPLTCLAAAVAYVIDVAA